MIETIEVRSIADWERLLSSVAGFHDGIVVGVALCGKEYVGPDLSMVYNGYPDAVVDIQFQSASQSHLTLVFAGVHRVAYDYNKDVDDEGAVAVWTGPTLHARFLSIEIVAESAIANLFSSRSEADTRARYAGLLRDLS
jgi:hypothetical protein